MKKIIAASLFLGVFIGLLFFAFFPIAVDAAGIIPCGRIEGTPEEQQPCTLCHLIVGVDRIIDYGFKIIVFVAIASIVAGGIFYITSAGNEQLMERAKSIIKNTFYGFAIVLLGWVIINYTMYLLGTKSDLRIGVVKWNEFTCSTVSSAGRGDGSLTGIGGGSGNAPIEKGGLKVSPGNIEFANVPIGQESGSKTITIENTNSSCPISMFQVGLTASPSKFNIKSNNCPSGGKELSAKKSCQVEMSFTPSSSGSYSGEFLITFSELGSLFCTDKKTYNTEINLTGTGI